MLSYRALASCCGHAQETTENVRQTAERILEEARALRTCLLLTLWERPFVKTVFI